MKGAESLLKGSRKQDIFTPAEIQEHFRRKANKYGSKKTIYNGVKYDSAKEASFAEKLDLLFKAKEVIYWQRQVTYDLVVNGSKICSYRLDFKVMMKNGEFEYWDIKGCKTGSAYQMFLLKKKLMAACHGIEVIEK